MLSKFEIAEKIQSAVEAQGCFLVDVKISRENDITITIDKADGEVDLVMCVAVSHSFEELYNRDEEDYSLTVTSSGLDGEFLVAAQFVKYTGKKVEMQLKGGRKIVALLNSCEIDGDVVKSVNVSYDTLAQVEGSKKKQKVSVTEDILLGNINIVKPYIEF